MKAEGEGAVPVAIGLGFDPLGAKVLTSNDGQGVDSVIMGMVRVIILSGMVVGQEVPHGAETVETCGSLDQGDDLVPIQ